MSSELEILEYDIADIEAIVEENGTGPEAVIPILQAIQKKYRYLPGVALERVCELTNILPSDIEGVATFYTQFRREPSGKIFEAKGHKLNVRTVGNGKTTAIWVDKYLKSIELAPDPKLFASKYGKLDKPNLSRLLENKTFMHIPKIEGELVDARAEAGRCLHCDCRKRVSCGLRCAEKEALRL